MSAISYDSRAVCVDGARILVLSGAVHYPRSTPAQWPEIMRRSREAGLNTIETYVFWNLHERRRGVYDFTGRLDLRRFCDVAQAHGLHVMLRIGPYICAETNFGGLPPWLREVPGMCIRTWNLPFMAEMERWMRVLCTHLRPCFAPAGGPIILAQVENEYSNIAAYYGDAGQRYCQWAVDMGQSLALGVPWVMCAGGAPGAIETINEGFGHKQIERHFAQHPDQPALWTEAYPGWYDTWGYGHHTRSSEDMAYAVARFFAAGGTGINYYMWHGGTNFARETMYLQTASYDFDAPLDEYALETTKSRHLARLHRLFSDAAPLLLGQARPQPQVLGEAQVAFVYHDAAGGDLVFLCNDAEQEATVAWQGREVRLLPRQVLALRGAEVVLDTHAIAAEDRVVRSWQDTGTTFATWSCWDEPLPGSRTSIPRRTVEAPQPCEQLALTADESDYCWYTTTCRVGGREPVSASLVLEGVADVVHVFVDGELAATSPLPLAENRKLRNNEGFTQTLPLTLPPGRHKIQLLCAALGLIKGDWMLGFMNMVHERKGLWGRAVWNGHELPGPWRMTPGLAGETAGAFAGAGALLPWRRVEPTAGQPLRWWRASFSRPVGAGPFALDLAGMGKGLVWLNGQCLSRYWLILSSGRNPISPGEPIIPREGDEPTQRYYQVPADWLQDENTLVLFDEIGGSPDAVRLVRRG